MIDALWTDRPSPIALMDAWPELASAIPSGDRSLGRRALTTRQILIDDGPVEHALAALPGRPFAALVVSGAALRVTKLGDRDAAELIGPGDLIDCSSSGDGDDMLPAFPCEHRVLESLTVAALDDSFRLAGRRWPVLHDVLQARRTRQVREAQRMLAILHLPHVEDRLAALFGILAARWGRVTPNGIVIDLRLTHGLLGDLAAARRPTISLALKALAEAGAIARGHDGRWIIDTVAMDGADGVVRPWRKPRPALRAVSAL